MSEADLKKRLFDLLREDEEFRYAVVGLLGYRDILDRLEEHNLTFFDSFHAASALSLPDQSIVSFDRAYDRVAGLRRIDPADFA